MRRLLLDICGKEKEGKSFFVCTAPDPIDFISTEPGRAQDVLERFDGQRHINLIPLHLTEEIPVSLSGMKQDEAKVREVHGKVWDEFEDAFYQALLNKQSRTVAVENGTTLYRWARLGEFGRREKVLPRKYGPVNAAIDRVLKAGWAADKNVIWVHRLTEEWKPKDPKNPESERFSTGRWIRDGHKSIGYEVQTVVTVFREKYGDNARQFGFRIEECAQNPDLVGEQVVASDTSPWGRDVPAANFLTLAMMVYPNSREEDWR